MNVNLNEYVNVFFNGGYLSKAPRFNNVFDYNNQLFKEIKNEIVKALEIGSSFKKKKTAIDLNAYLTKWENKPAPGGITVVIDDDVFKANINGMDALHMGIELDAAYKILPNLDIQGLVSLGDWRWKSEDTVRIYDDNQNLVGKQYFNATNVHVGDAAQTQLASSIRYEPLKGLYVSGKITCFQDYYADFDPLTLDGSPNSVDADGNPRDSWKIPPYYLVDAHAGYYFKLKKINFSLRLSVLNVLDKLYISDASNNDFYVTPYSDFDAKSAGVFVGMGRRITTSLQMTF